MKLSLLLFIKPIFCFAGINFIHITKCGGTSLFSLFSQNFKAEEIYPHLVFKLPVDKMPLINHQFAMGHFPYWFFVNNDVNFNCSFNFTVLRDPIERVISHYFYWRQNHPHWKNNLDGYSISRIPKNEMCTYLCSIPGLKDEELLQNAISTLKTLDFVFFMDDFEEGACKLFYILDLKLPVKIPHENITKKALFDEETLKIIAENNDLDIRLYEYAKTHYKDNKIY